MRLNILYVCVAAMLFSCTNDVNNISHTTPQLTKSNKGNSNVVTKTTTTETATATSTQNSCGKECDDKKSSCWNNKMMLW